MLLRLGLSVRVCVCRQKGYCILIFILSQNLNVCGLAAQNSSDCISELACVKMKWRRENQNSFIRWKIFRLQLLRMFLLLAHFLSDILKPRIWMLSVLCSPAGLPDPFAKVVVDGSGQCHSTDTVKSTLDPKWNQHYDLWVWLQISSYPFFFSLKKTKKTPLCLVCSYIGKTDSITISIWNHKKIHKRQGAGFLGCIRLLSNAISRLKDTGCKCELVWASAR